MEQVEKKSNSLRRRQAGWVHGTASVTVNGGKEWNGEPVDTGPRLAMKVIYGAQGRGARKAKYQGLEKG